MINISKVKAYCKDYQNIENFAEAYNDLSETWHCHHKLEIHGDYENTMEDLKLMNLYYNRPAAELIFLRASDHISLHLKGKIPNNHNDLIISNIGRKNTDESKQRMSESAKHRKKPHPGGKCFKGMKWKVVDGKREWYV